MRARSNSKRAKRGALSEDGTLNPSPEKVHDPKFRLLRASSMGTMSCRSDTRRSRPRSLDNLPVTAASRRVWRIQADLLSGKGKLRRSRDCGTGAKEARPPRPTQDRRPGPDLSSFNEHPHIHSLHEPVLRHSSTIRILGQAPISSNNFSLLIGASQRISMILA